MIKQETQWERKDRIANAIANAYSECYDLTDLLEIFEQSITNSKFYQDTTILQARLRLVRKVMKTDGAKLMMQINEEEV